MLSELPAHIVSTDTVAVLMTMAITMFPLDRTVCMTEFVVLRAMRAMLWMIAARDQKTSRICLLTFLLNRRAAQDERARFANVSHTSQA